MRVVEVISDRNVGGAGVLLTNRLKHRTKDIETIVALPKGSKLTKKIRETGTRTVEISGCNDCSLDVLAIPELVLLFKAQKPDIVNSHGCLSARIAAKLTGVPTVIYTRHCCFPLGKAYSLKPVRALTHAGSLLLCDKVIAVSPAVKKDLIDMGISSSQIQVIVNGAEPLRRLRGNERAAKRRELSIADSEIVVGIFARLEVCKDHETLLRAARILCNGCGEYRFLIVGTGGTEARLKSLCSELGLAERVIFTGFVEDIAPLMNITDVNVNCSVATETSSLALSEGMSLGIPSVVSDFGGNPYMVRNGVNGLVYPKGNAEGLARAIRRLAYDDALYSKLSENSLRRFYAELNAKRMANETNAFYRNLYLEKRQ